MRPANSLPDVSMPVSRIAIVTPLPVTPRSYAYAAFADITDPEALYSAVSADDTWVGAGVGAGDGTGVGTEGVGALPDELTPPPPHAPSSRDSAVNAVGFVKPRSNPLRQSLATSTPEPPFASCRPAIKPTAPPCRDEAVPAQEPGIQNPALRQARVSLGLRPGHAHPLPGRMVFGPGFGYSTTRF